VRILWISDAGTPTGFGRVTHAIGERLVAMGHDVHVLAIGYDGSNPNEGPLKLYRADAEVDVEMQGHKRRAKHPVGFARIVELLDRLHPDVVVTLMDNPLLVALLTDNPFDSSKRLINGPPIVSYMPIDGYELPHTWKVLFPLVTPVAMSKFGREQLQLIGAPDMPVVYHGVDDSVFHPVSQFSPIALSTGDIVTDKVGCRDQFNIPPDAFVVGRVDTNSGRKDWPATWRVIEQVFQRSDRPEDMIAVFHTKLTNPGAGVDLPALISKGTGKFIVTNGGGWPIEDVVALINSWDLFLTTSRGEGFGLGTAEAAACGVPALATRCSAITEVVGPGGVLIDPLEKAYWSNPYGVVQKMTDTDAMSDMLADLSMDPGLLRHLGQKAIAHASTFSWDVAAEKFDTIIRTRVAEGEAVAV
jgi:glycosyltransferase involved in cell wall biosynthesis